MDIPACRLYCSRLCPIRLNIGFKSYSDIASCTASPIFEISMPALAVAIAASSPAADASIISSCKLI